MGVRQWYGGREERIKGLFSMKKSDRIPNASVRIDENVLLQFFEDMERIENSRTAEEIFSNTQRGRYRQTIV